MTNSKMSLEMAAEFKMKSSLFESEMISAFIQARSDPEKALEMGERVLAKLPEYADEDHRHPNCSNSCIQHIGHWVNGKRPWICTSDFGIS